MDCDSSAVSLYVGTIYLGTGEDRDAVRILEGDTEVARASIDVLGLPQLGPLSRWRNKVTKVLVGFSDGGPDHLDYLAEVPQARDVWILNSKIRDLNGLTNLRQLQRLSIDRPTAKFHALARLHSLENIFIDDWRPGAESLFGLTKIRHASLRKLKRRDLLDLSEWRDLNELCLSAGTVEAVDGLPPSVQKLELQSLRNLQCINALRNIPNLRELVILTCGRFANLDGLQGCSQLEVLSISGTAPLQSLEPLRDLKQLSYLVLTPRAGQWSSIEPLYTLPNLEMLIIGAGSRIDQERLRKTSPNVEITLAR